MPFWDNWITKQDQELSTTVPLNLDVGQATYPDSNYENFASEGYNKNEIVHACIRELATSAASPRYFVQAPSTDGGTIEIDRGLLYDLTSKPNPYHDWYSFIEQLVTYLMVAGNAYAIKERARSNQVSSLYLLRPDRVTIVAGDYGADSYIYEVGGKRYEIEAANMCHLSLPNPAGDLYGLSPLQVLARNVNLDLNMTDFAKTYFQNAGVPSGLLKLKKRLSSQEEASTIRSRWRSQFGGVNNFHRVAILDDDAEYQPMANSPKDMSLDGLHNLTESRICAVFGVPPILVGANVGLQRSTFSNYREARLAFHSETLEPLVARILRYFNRNLFDEYTGNETLSVDWAQMRGVLDDQAAATAQVNLLFTGGIITLNEAREKLGFDAVSEGAIRRVPSAVMEVAEGQSATVAVDEAPVEQSAPNMIEAKKKPRVAPRGQILRREMIKQREEEADVLARQVQTHFRGIRNRVDGILGRHMERNTTTTKDYPFQPIDMLPPIETGNMSTILEKAYRRVSKRTFGTINTVGIAGELPWSDKLPTIQNILTSAPTRAALIHRTTSKAIGKAVGIGLERGYSIEQLARGVPDDNFPGIRSVLTETQNRARLIARTEVMRTQNQSTVGFYKEQGFAYVQADDVDGDPDDNYIDPGDPYGRTCAERHNQIYSLEDAQNIDDHPNGTLNWMPMPRGYKPETQPGGVPTDVPRTPDRSSPQVSGFDPSQWAGPTVKTGKGVNPVVAENANAHIRQTVMSMKGDTGEYVAKLYEANAKSVPQILNSRSRLFNRRDPATGKPMKAGGFYNNNTDIIRVATGNTEHAMTHEIGHQITSRSHLAKILGEKKAKQFAREIDDAYFDAIERRRINPNSSVVSDYGMKSVREYIAEGFHFAVQNPEKLAKVDPGLSKVMHKYLVGKKRVLIDDVPGFDAAAYTERLRQGARTTNVQVGGRVVSDDVARRNPIGIGG